MNLRFEIEEVGEVKKQFRVRGYEKDTELLVSQYIFEKYDDVLEYLMCHLSEGRIS